MKDNRDDMDALFSMLSEKNKDIITSVAKKLLAAQETAEQSCHPAERTVS